MSALIWLGAIIAEVMIAYVMDNSLWMWGIIIVTFGILFWDCLHHGYANQKKAVGGMSIYCFAWGGLVLLASYAEDKIDFFDLTGYVFLYGFGLMFILLGIYMGIAKVIGCNTKIVGKYTGATAYRSKNVTLYTPGFVYEYKGRRYRNTSGETFSRRKIGKMFQQGGSYSIYIDPKHPESFLVRRRIGKSAMLMLVIGVVIFLVPFCD